MAAALAHAPANAVGISHLGEGNLLGGGTQGQGVGAAELHLGAADQHGREAVGCGEGEKRLAVGSLQGNLRPRRLGGAGVKQGGLGGGLGHGLQHGGAAAGHHSTAVYVANTAVLAAIVQGAVAAITYEANIDQAAVYIDIAVGVNAVSVSAGGIQQRYGSAVDGDAGETAIGGLRAAGVDAVIGRGDSDVAVLYENFRGLNALAAAIDSDAAAENGNGGIAAEGVVSGAEGEGRTGNMEAVIDMDGVRRSGDGDGAADAGAGTEHQRR